MALGDPWIRARSDRPTHFTIGDCEPGRLGLRWCVMSSTGINFCGLINLEDGVLVKYDRVLSFAPTPPTTRWQRTDDDVGVIYSVEKRTDVSPSSFQVVISVPPFCFILFNQEQPQDEELLTELESDTLTQIGSCAVNPMLDDLKVEFYATEDAALVDWPDAQIWVWE